MKNKNIEAAEVVGQKRRENMKLYKVLKEGRSCNGGDAAWSQPLKTDGKWTPGEWMPSIVGKLEPCVNGYHLCRPEDLLVWLNEEIYEAEYEGEMIEDTDKIVVRKCRLTRRCENWTEESARLFACWCVRNTPLADGRRTWDLLTDERSKEAVEIAERYARGEASDTQLTAAWAAAWDAAGDAARAAAGDAARDAARAAAWAAAGDAARDAAWAVAWAAAGDAQTKELLCILEKEVKR